MAPSYSVLMPLAPWESPEIVAKALRSLVRQSWRPTQLVVSCDGSPPDPLRSVLEAPDLPLEILEGPGQEGVGPVLARGLSQCVHELVVRADADDICLPHRCERQLQVMQASPRLAALSAAVAEFVDPGGTVTGVRRVPTTPEAIVALSRWRNPLNHPAAVLRRSYVLAVGNYRACPGFEDYDLWLRLLQHWGFQSLANLEEILVRVRVGPDHLSRRHGWRYGCQEARFLATCIRDDLLPFYQVVLLLLIRVPLRVLPIQLLQCLMKKIRAAAPIC